LDVLEHDSIRPRRRGRRESAFTSKPKIIEKMPISCNGSKCDRRPASLIDCSDLDITLNGTS
jgi:hypothetical protein